MRRLITAAGASAMLLLAAACAQSGNEAKQPAEQAAQPGAGLSTSAKAPAAPGAGAGAAQQKAPVGGKRVAAEQINASALPSDYPRKVWTLRGGKTVAAYGQSGACSTVRLVVENQTPQQVRLRFVEKKPDANQMCTMQLEQEPVTAGLKQPLGDRELLLDLKRV